MHATNSNLPNYAPATGAMKLTRNNMEFAGLVIYFAAIAFFFAFAFIVMVFELGVGPKEKAANDKATAVASILRQG
jgi:hypothetical protein